MKKVFLGLIVMFIAGLQVTSLYGAETQKQIHIQNRSSAAGQAAPSDGTLSLKVTVLNSAEISLSWNRLACGGYRIDKKKAGGSYAQLSLMAEGEISFVDTKIDPNAPYTYRVFTRCGGKDIYSKEIAINTGSNNPYAETLPCPQTVESNITIKNYGQWQGYNVNSAVNLYAAYTQEGSGNTMRLICRYQACDTCMPLTITRTVPAGACRQAELKMAEKIFKCKKGAF